MGSVVCEKCSGNTFIIWNDEKRHSIWITCVMCKEQTKIIN